MQMHMDNSISAGILQNSTAPVNIPGSPMGMFPLFLTIYLFSYPLILISGLLQSSTAPVNIPGSHLNSFSPSNHSNLFPVSDHFANTIGSGSGSKLNNSYGASDNLFFHSNLISPGMGDGLSMSPDLK